MHQQCIWSGHAADGHHVPILIGLGVSRLSATAAVATTLCFDWSPSDTGTILSAETAGLNPVVYWTDYQVPIVLVAFVVVGTLHYFTQKYMDKRDGHVVQPMEVEKPAEDDPADSAPLWYAVLPVIPLALTSPSARCGSPQSK